MKRIGILAAAIILLAASCGTSYKVFDIAPEEFISRYNANLERVIPNANLASRLKFKGATTIDKGKGNFVSLDTQQSYLAVELSMSPDMVHVHFRVDDEIVSHNAEFKLMAMVAAYSIDGNDDPDLRRWNDTLQVFNNLFAQFDSGNFSPSVTRNGITYSLSPGLGDFAGKLKTESIWFTAKKVK